MNLINMIDDVCNGKFGNYEVLIEDQKIDKIATFMCNMISQYLAEDADKDVVYNKQLALGEHNVVTLLLELGNILL